MSTAFPPKIGMLSNLPCYGRVQKFVSLHRAGLVDVLDAVHDKRALNALNCLSNGAAQQVTEPESAADLISGLLETFESASHAMLFEHSANYRGDDLLAAWNYYGARLAELASEHRQAIVAWHVSPDD